MAERASRDTILRQYREHVNKGVATLAEFMGTSVEVRSEGSLIYDQEGEAYLSCGGYGVFILGHRHPAVLNAVRAQLDQHPLTSRILLSGELASAAEALAAVAPSGLDYVCFTNSGTEAVEVGLKIARLSGKRRVVAMQQGFHGKTMGSLSVTGRERYRAPFVPLLPDVTFVAFGEIAALEKELSDRPDDACVILEPVQGEGGVRVPPEGYLRQVRATCSEYGAFLIFDEIQTGLGRLGAWWGADREDVVPDVLLVGKGLSGGIMPIGAAVTSSEAYEPLNRDPLLHTSTFAGNPLAAVAAEAAIAVIAREDIPSRAARVGEDILCKLRNLLGPFPSSVTEVRGVGLLIGIEFSAEYLAADFMMELLSNRVLVSLSLNAERVIRITPPALISDAELAWLYDAVANASSAIHNRYFRGKVN